MHWRQFKNTAPSRAGIWRFAGSCAVTRSARAGMTLFPEPHGRIRVPAAGRVALRWSAPAGGRAQRCGLASRCPGEKNAPLIWARHSFVCWNRRLLRGRSIPWRIFNERTFSKHPGMDLQMGRQLRLVRCGIYAAHPHGHAALRHQEQEEHARDEQDSAQGCPASEEVCQR